MYYDTHVHTRFSPDGSSDMEEYISLIDEGKIKGIGFSEHLDFMPECGAFGFLDYAAYMKKVKALREKGYEVFAGAEIDYNYSVERDILKIIKEFKYDYNICSVHMVGGHAISDRKAYRELNDPVYFEKVLEGYYKELLSCLEVKEFDVIGHVGIFNRYLSQEYLNNHPSKSRIKEIFSDLAKKCAQSGKIIEVNTSGLFAAIDSTIPDKNFLNAYYNYGGRQLSIGSDAHNTSNLGRGIEKAISIIKEIGFNYIILPWDKEKPLYV